MVIQRHLSSHLLLSQTNYAMSDKTNMKPTSTPMGQRIKAFHKHWRNQPDNGFSIAELTLSVAAGALLIAGGAVGMRSISSAMQASDEIAGLRSSASTGLRLLRSEVQRSLHLMVAGGEAENNQSFTDLSPEDTQLCESKSSEKNKPFNPIFGLQMYDFDNPVIYGLGVAKNNINYALIRCGPALSADGRYEVENVTLASIFENVGVVPCDEDQCDSKFSREDVIASLDNALQEQIYDQAGKPTLEAEKVNRSLIRSYPEPAFAIQTDSVRKLLKIVDPTTNSDPILFSFLQPPGSRRNLQVDLNFTAYARADKINRSDLDNSSGNSDTNSPVINDGLSGCDGNGCQFYGLPVEGDKIQLIVDGSGSMSQCIHWAGFSGNQKRTFYNGSRYKDTKDVCHLTRMESLQNELRNLIEQLSETTSIRLQSFSSSGYKNHRKWEDGKMLQLTAANRKSALEFVKSLSAAPVRSWGGTHPWPALDEAFSHPSKTAIYFMTDGDPNKDRNNGRWTNFDVQPTANYYIKINGADGNDKQVANTISVGQKSKWLELISNGTSGEYREIGIAPEK